MQGSLSLAQNFFESLRCRLRIPIEIDARDLNRRGLDQGNFVFVGGPTSNPWVSLYADELNFEVVEDGVSGKMYFSNKKPLPGKQSTCEGLRYTGSGGEDHATISLLPSSSGQENSPK